VSFFNKNSSNQDDDYSGKKSISKDNSWNNNNKYNNGSKLNRQNSG